MPRSWRAASIAPRAATSREVLNALVALGLARRLDDNRYAP
jgi:hypothetical protein